MAQLPTPPNGASDSTVISLQTRVFCRCYALRKVLAPGCKQFGAQVFEECCSLIQIGIRNDATNQPAPQAELMPRAFEKCTALRQLDLEQPECNPNSLPRCLPECCFLEAGLISLTLPPDFEPCWSRGRLDMLPFMPPPLEEGTGQATRVAFCLCLVAFSHSSYTRPFVTGILEIPITKAVVFSLLSLFDLFVSGRCPQPSSLPDIYRVVQFCLVWTNWL